MEENSIIEEALPILRNNVDAICTVGEWAEQTGYSRTHFSMLIRREFEDTPYTIIGQENIKRSASWFEVTPTKKELLSPERQDFQT